MPLKAIPTQKANLWLCFHECKCYLMVWTPGLVYIWRRTNYHFRDFLFVLRQREYKQEGGTSCHSSFHTFVSFFLSFCGLVSRPALNIVQWPGTFRPEKQENLVEYWFCVAKRAHTHTHTPLRYIGRGFVPSVTSVNIHVYLNVKYTAGVILNFNCTAFNRTLCALTT